MREERRRLGRRGATAVFVAVALAAVLSMVALGVDLGMLLKLRSDAQRTADAAALAGAQEFRKAKPEDAKVPALTEALAYAESNYVGWKGVKTAGAIITDSGSRLVANAPEAYVQVIPDSQKVRVFIRRAANPTWFGHMLGIKFVPITAKAAAWAVDAGTGKCVKPFAIPDLWSDADNDNDIANRLPDIVGTQGKKGGEDWAYDQAVGDRYVRYGDPDNTDPNQWTGLGSSWRNDSYYKADQATPKYYFDDYGRPFTIKPANPQETPSPGDFYAWTMPYDDANAGAYGGASPGPGAQWYEWNIRHCNPAAVAIGTEVTLDVEFQNKPGNMIGPTYQAMSSDRSRDSSLISQDSLACWFEFTETKDGKVYTTGEVRKRNPGSSSCSQTYPSWENSPRVALVPLFDPAMAQSGRTSLKFNNLAVIFIEGQTNQNEPVMARFLYFAKATGPLGPVTGSLIKKLQLIE